MKKILVTLAFLIIPLALLAQDNLPPSTAAVADPCHGAFRTAERSSTVPK